MPQEETMWILVVDGPDKVHVKEIEIHPIDDELPTLHDVKELGKWDIGGKTAVEFLRSIRSEYG